MSTTTSSGSSGPPLPPSYIDYSNANGILTIVGFVTALALVTVILRIYVRTAILKVVGLDDYLMVLAMVSKKRDFARILLSANECSCYH